jgi:hypothetical protein
VNAADWAAIGIVGMVGFAIAFTFAVGLGRAGARELPPPPDEEEQP